LHLFKLAIAVKENEEDLGYGIGDCGFIKAE
jgi:hypothetical protein